MKLSHINRFLAAVVFTMTAYDSSNAAPITKAATGTVLTATASWTGGVVPTSSAVTMQ